jgi:hypothetical protein
MILTFGIKLSSNIIDAKKPDDRIVRKQIERILDWSLDCIYCTTGALFNPNASLTAVPRQPMFIAESDDGEAVRCHRFHRFVCVRESQHVHWTVIVLKRQSSSCARVKVLLLYKSVFLLVAPTSCRLNNTK